MHAPRTEHLNVEHKILKHLKRSPGQVILHSRHDHLAAEAYLNANWAGLETDRRLTICYCTMVVKNLVFWKSEKHPMVSRSPILKLNTELMVHGAGELL